MTDDPLVKLSESLLISGSLLAGPASYVLARTPMQIEIAGKGVVAVDRGLLKEKLNGLLVDPSWDKAPKPFCTGDFLNEAKYLQPQCRDCNCDHHVDPSFRLRINCDAGLAVSMDYNALAYGYLQSSGDPGEGLVRFLHVLNVLPDLMYLTTLLTGCLCLLCPLATATLPFHVICGLFSVPPFVTPLPLNSFLNMLNGSIVKLCFLWLPLDTSFPLACFLITDTLLNIFFICAIHACSQTGYFSFAMESNRTKNYRWGPFSRFLKSVH